MKEYYVEDERGRVRVIEQDNGVKVELVEEPSQEYIDGLPPDEDEEQDRIEEFRQKLADARTNEEKIALIAEYLGLTETEATRV